MKHPWTHEELVALRRDLETSITATEEELPDIRPLPPMEEGEAKAMLLAMTDAAKARTLTGEEAFMIGQLLRQYQMAVEARMLGKQGGRYYVIHETDINRMLQEKKESE